MNAIIIDDEKFNIKNLEFLLEENHPNISVVNTFTNVEEANDFINKNAIDLIFLDIEMPIQNGFDLLSYFPERSFQVIFVTAHEEYALKAIKAGATDYILKPILLEELSNAIEKAVQLHQEKYRFKSNGKIALSYCDGKVLVDPEEIIYIQGVDNISKVFLTQNRRVLISKTLKYFEDILDSRFFRLHKSFLVNLEFSSCLHSRNGFELELSNQIKIPVSRRNYKELSQKLAG